MISLVKSLAHGFCYQEIVWIQKRHAMIISVHNAVKVATWNDVGFFSRVAEIILK